MSTMRKTLPLRTYSVETLPTAKWQMKMYFRIKLLSFTAIDSWKGRLFLFRFVEVAE